MRRPSTIAACAAGLKRLDEALASYDKALALKPDYAKAFNNRGNALQDLKRLDEALASYDKALALKPDYAEALNNRGNALRELKRFDEALASYDRALAARPDHAHAFSGDHDCVNKLCDWRRTTVVADEVIAHVSATEIDHFSLRVARLLRRSGVATAMRQRTLSRQASVAPATIMDRHDVAP